MKITNRATTLPPTTTTTTTTIILEQGNPSRKRQESDTTVPPNGDSHLFEKSNMAESALRNKPTYLSPFSPFPLLPSSFPHHHRQKVRNYTRQKGIDNWLR